MRAISGRIGIGARARRAMSAAAAAMLTGGLLAACAAKTAPDLTYSDPFDYCTAIGTIDAPNGRYTGPPMPQPIGLGLRRAFGAPADAPLDAFTRGASWRCMGGQVYACTVGANLPCQAKADTRRAPSPFAMSFCRANPAADVIPAYVTGRETVYQWRCANGAPEIVRQVETPDARGFLSNIWYAIEPVR